MPSLGTLPGDVFAEGNGINNEGQVVGQSWGPNGCNGFLWQNRLMINLNALTADPSLRAVDPIAINSRGQIVGVALQTSTGEAHAFLATPCDDDHPTSRAVTTALVDASAEASAVTPSPGMKIASPVIQGDPGFGGKGNPMLLSLRPPFRAVESAAGVSQHRERSEAMNYKSTYRSFLLLVLLLTLSRMALASTTWYVGSTRESEGTRDLSGNGFWGLKRSR